MSTASKNTVRYCKGTLFYDCLCSHPEKHSYVDWWCSLTLIMTKPQTKLSQEAIMRGLCFRLLSSEVLE